MPLLTSVLPKDLAEPALPLTMSVIMHWLTSQQHLSLRPSANVQMKVKTITYPWGKHEHEEKFIHVVRDPELELSLPPLIKSCFSVKVKKLKKLLSAAANNRMFYYNMHLEHIHTAVFMFLTGCI